MDSLNEILAYLYSNPTARLITTVVLIIIALIVVWLLLRNIRLWYWKTEKVISSLNSIEERLSDIERSMDRVKINLEINANQNGFNGKEEKIRAITDGADRNKSGEVSDVLLRMEQVKKDLENKLTAEEIAGRIRD